jgi:hypothetical protein
VARASLDAVRAEAQSGKRPLRSLLELHALNGWTPQLIGCLLPLVTIHSGMTAPSASAAPAQLASLLGMTRVNIDGNIVDDITVAGELYRIEASTRQPPSSSRSAWMVRITGDLQTPYWVLGSYPAGLPDALPPSCFNPQAAL